MDSRFSRKHGFLQGFVVGVIFWLLASQVRGGVVPVRGGASGAAVDSRGEMWIWGEMASRLGVADPTLIAPQPRRVERPAGVAGWTQAVMADLLVARSTAGELFLLQTDGLARLRAVQQPQSLGPGWGGSLQFVRWRRGSPDGRAAVLGVAGLNADGAVELVRMLVPFEQQAGEVPVGNVDAERRVLAFPPDVLRWRELAAGEGWILACTEDGRLYEYLLDDPLDPAGSWRTGPVPPAGTGWVRVTGVRGERAAWDSAGDLHVWGWDEDSADDRTRGRVGIPRPVPPSQTGVRWVAFGGWTTEFHLLNELGEVWRTGGSFNGLERVASPRPLRTLECSYSARFAEDSEGRVWVQGSWNDGQLGTFDDSSPEFMPLRGPVLPFHPPGLGPTSVRLSVVQSEGSSAADPNVPGIPVRFRVERSGDVSWPLKVPLAVEAPVLPGRLMLQIPGSNPVQPVLWTGGTFLPMEAGVTGTEFGLGLTFGNGGGAVVPVTVTLPDSPAFRTDGPASVSAALVQAVPRRKPWVYSYRWIDVASGRQATNPVHLELEVMAIPGQGEVRTAEFVRGGEAVRAAFGPRESEGVQRAILRWTQPVVPGWGTLSVEEEDGSVRVLSRQLGLPAVWIASPWVRLATRDPAGLAPTLLQVEAGVSNSVPTSFSVVVDGPAGFRFSTNAFGLPIRLELPAALEGDYATRVAVADTVVSQSLRVHGVPGRAEVTFSTNRAQVRRGETLDLALERRGDISGPSWIRLVVAGSAGPDIPPPRLELPAAQTNLDFRVLESVVAFPSGVRKVSVPVEFPLTASFRGNLGLDLSMEYLTNAFPGTHRSSRILLLENRDLGSVQVRLETAGPVSAAGVRLRARVEGRADRAGLLALEELRTLSVPRLLASARSEALEHLLEPDAAGLVLVQARFTDRWQQVYRSAVLPIQLAPELARPSDGRFGVPPQVWQVVPAYQPQSMDLEASTDLDRWEEVRPEWSPAEPLMIRLPDNLPTRCYRLRLR